MIDIKEELISVIVPVYNVDKYIDRCIETIVNQTYRNIEILLIDDGSTDDSGKICDTWANKDKRITVIHKENAGVSSARNLGLENSHGHFISFIDSDDSIDRNMYYEMKKMIEETNSDICFCDIKYIRNGNIEEKKHLDKEIFNKEEILKSLFDYNGLNLAAWNKLFRTNVIKNIRFREDISIREDALFCAEAFDNSKKICHLKKMPYNYYYREGSALNSKNLNKEITKLLANSEIIKILKKNNVNIFIEQEIQYICNFYKLKKEIEKRKLDINLTKYEEKVNEYLKEDICGKKITLRNKIKVILATKFTNIYFFISKR